MRSAFHDYTKAMLSAKKEKKRLAQGVERNANLPSNVVTKVNNLKSRIQQGNLDCAYALGLMYLEGTEVGYNPDLARQFLEIGAKRNHFNCNYALARFYRGHWSYQHQDAYKSMIYYANCTKCRNADPNFVREAIRAYNNDFGRESTKNGLQVWFKVDVPIN